MPTPTFTLISSNTLGSATASVTFSGIPSTYSDLCIKASLRHDGTGGNIWFAGISVNSLTTTIYSDKYAVTDFTSLIAGGNSNDTGTNIHALSIVQNNYTANTFSNTELYFPAYQYNGTKPFLSHMINENNAVNYNYLGFVANLVRTNDAITSIALRPNGSVGNFTANSSFYLYGIKNS